jgi:hypothetical protein
MAVARRAAAADGGEGPSLFPATGQFRGGAELETAAFNLDGQRGSYASAVARIEYNPLPHLALRARVPIDTLSLEGDPEVHNGLGDSELRLRVQLGRSDPLRVTGGCVTQLPTGSPHAGLGEGAVQITPFVSAGYKVDRTILYVTVADSMSLAGTHRERFPNYVDPSEDHELRATLGTIYVLTEAMSASALVTTTTVLTSVNRGQTLMTGAIQLGAQPDARFRLVISPQFPIFGEERFSWKLSTAATYSF